MSLFILGKRCSKCKIWQPYINFHKKSSMKDGRKPACIDCELKQASDYLARQKENNDQYLADRRMYWGDNKDRLNYNRRASRSGQNLIYVEQPKRIQDADRHQCIHPICNDVAVKRLFCNRHYESYAKPLGKVYYRRIEIFQRDFWSCYLCEMPIDPYLSLKDKMGATIDHVIPISYGGPDVASNVKAAHFICNSTKSNRLEGGKFL